MNILVLCGGVGAARLLCGFNELACKDNNLSVTAIVNTGDDDHFYGFYVCPDIDSILYHLSNLHDNERGWGRKEDRFHFVESLRELGQDAWFNLGDKDMALNFVRTTMLNTGSSLSETTEFLTKSLNINNINVLPMCDEQAKTRIATTHIGELSLQEYFVKERCSPVISDIKYGSEHVMMSHTLNEHLSNADKIIIAPSNPFLSINPILKIRGIRDVLQTYKHKVIAVSPIVSGQAIKGPLAQILENYQLEVSPTSIARLYEDIVNTFVFDEEDRRISDEISALGIKPVVCDTIMSSQTKRAKLAQTLIEMNS